MTIDSLRTSARELLEDNILKFWIDNMQDKENGGFYGRIDGHNTLHPEAEKGAIINARILWTFSAAYRVLTDGQQPTAKSRTYLEMATRAKDYMIEHFIDHEYGGVYWSVDYKGNPLDTKKQFYAIGFAIYGLSEYARATGDREALDYALNLYECIEEHALDRENNGYIEAMTRTWQPIADMRLSEHDANYPKSQNTHLHIIEPYTNLYRCLKEMRDAESCDPMETLSRVEASLRNIINIFTDRILNPQTHHLDLFFENDWTRGAGQLESYGHDIECSWLMHEAAMVLGDQDVLKKMEPIVVEVAKASEKGLLPSGAMIHEADLTRGTVDDDLHWWVQAEAVVGFLNIYQYFGDEAALDKAFRCYQYILDELVDYENGEWYWSRKPDGSINREEDKAGFWKCPYHNGRMCLEIIERFNTNT